MQTTARNWKRVSVATLILVAGVWMAAPRAWAEKTDEPKPEKKNASKESEQQKVKKMREAQQKAVEAYEAQKKKEADQRKNDPAWKPSHEPTAVIKMNDKGQSGVALNNFCINTDGNILACCSGAKNEIRVFSPDGKLVRSWPLEFKPEAICVADDGAIFVAGAGHVAKVDQDGKVLLAAASPQMAELNALYPPPEKKKEAKEDAAAKEAKQKRVAELQAKSKELQAEMRKVQEECEKVAAEDLGVKTKDMSKAEIKQAVREKFETLPGDKQEAIQKKFQAKILPVAEKLNAALRELQEANTSPEQLAMQRRAQMEQKSTITGIAVSKDDVFIACSMAKTYGYAIWRVDRDFANPKQIIEGLRGCCGQMDVQAYDGKVWIPHNCSHKVECYDRDGKRLSSFGKNDRKAADGFGGCCEPKNLRINAKGEVYASESGPPVTIKRFTPEGKFLGVVGLPKYETGCVRVTIDMSRDGKTVYILDPGNNAIHVLTEKKVDTEKKADSAQKADAEKKADSGENNDSDEDPYE